MNTPFNKQHGVSVIKFIALTPLILIGLVVLAFIFTLLNKAYWDYRVKQMCEKDDGVKVYERVFLSALEYESHSGPDGRLIAPPESNSDNTQYLYFSKYKKSYIRESNPGVYKRETIIYRKLDSKELGSMIHYRRVGGDFPTIIFHTSGFGCEGTTNLRSLLDEIFFIKGNLK